MVSKWSKKPTHLLWFCHSRIFQSNRSELAIAPMCTWIGEDASADMLYGDINLANHRANGESSWIKRRTQLSQRVCALCFSCLSHKAITDWRGKPTQRGSSDERRDERDTEWAVCTGILNIVFKISSIRNTRNFKNILTPITTEHN